MNRVPLIIGDPECVAPVGALLGEGPVWDPRDERLYFVDIKGETLFAYDPESKTTERWNAPQMLSAVGLHRDGGFIGACKNGFVRVIVSKAGLQVTPLAHPEAKLANNRFNDGKVAPDGSFWAGTMDDREVETSGSWWRYNGVDDMAQIATGFHVTNGPAFDTSRNRVYLTDSAAQKIFVAEPCGRYIENLRIFLQFDLDQGYPDGMEVDAEGCLWVAFWDGGCVRRFNPAGDLIAELSLPVSRPTSIALIADRIFITTARIGMDDDTLSREKQAGGLFEARFSTHLGQQATHYFE